MVIKFDYVQFHEKNNNKKIKLINKQKQIQL